jgi:hypothetical protein
VRVAEATASCTLYDHKTNNTMTELNAYSLKDITVITDASGHNIKN